MKTTTHLLNSLYEVCSFARPISLIAVLLVLSQASIAQNVGIGTDTPDASAMIDITSTDKGVLVPRMSAVARQAIVDPAVGLMVYDSTNNAFYYFTGDGWLEMRAGSIDRMTDADGDTRIEMELSPDEDVMYFTVGGAGAGNIRRSTGGLPLFWFASGNGSLILGEHAGSNLTIGEHNAFYGFGAGNAMSEGNNNVLMGRDAGRSIQYGSENTILGASAGFYATGTGNVFLGYNAGRSELGSHKLYIDNSQTSNPLIYGEFDNSLVRIRGTLNINNAYAFPSVDGSAGQILQSNGAGTLQWTYPVLHDADNDTKIQVEESADEDIIRFDMGGQEKLVFDGPHIYVNNSTSTFLGNFAGLNDDLTNNNNVFIGSDAGRENIAGLNNVAVGESALKNNLSHFNTAVGYDALTSATNAINSVALGSTALRNNVDGGNNIGIGSQALHGNLHGSNNVAIGSAAGSSNTGSGNVFLGFNAGKNETGNNTLYIENSDAANPLIYGNFQSDLVRINGTLNINNAFSFPLADGSAGQVLQSNGSGALTWIDQSNTDNQTLDTFLLAGDTLLISLINDDVPAQVVDLSGINRVQSLIEDADGDTYVQAESSPDEDVIRLSAGGVEYVVLDSGRINVLNTGNSIFIGNQAGANDDFSDNRNTAIGTNAMVANTTGRWNTATGYAALTQNIAGGNNVANGFAALNSNTGGSDNTAIGFRALTQSLTGQQNVAIGSGAGEGLSTGTGNVFLGFQAGKGQNGSNQLYIDNSDTTAPLLYGEFDHDLLTVNGRLTVRNGFTDADNDTKIQVEESLDENKIRFDLDGLERFRMEDSRFIVSSGVFGLGSTMDVDFMEGGKHNRIRSVIPSDIDAGISSNFKLDFDLNGTTALALNGAGEVTVNNQYTFPPTDGDASQVLTTDGNGNVTWQNNADYWTLSGNNISNNNSGNVQANGMTFQSDGVLNTNGNWISGDGGAEGIQISATGEVGIGAGPNTRLLHVRRDLTTEDEYVAEFVNLGYSDPESTTQYRCIRIRAGRDVNNDADSHLVLFSRPDATTIGGIIQNNANTVQYNTTSDQRLKANITPTHFGVSDLMKIEVKDYVYRDEPGDPQIGFIAQQLHSVYPDVVHVGGEDPKTDPWMVEYGKLTPLLVKAIQDQQQMITAQEQRIADLEQALMVLSGRDEQTLSDAQVSRQKEE